MMLNRLVRSKLTTSQKTLPQLPGLANATWWAQGSPAPASPAPRQGCISQVHRGHHRPSPRYAHIRLCWPKNTHSPPPRWAEVPLITVPTPALPCTPAKQILERSTPGVTRQTPPPHPSSSSGAGLACPLLLPSFLPQGRRGVETSPRQLVFPVLLKGCCIYSEGNCWNAQGQFKRYLHCLIPF